MDNVQIKKPYSDEIINLIENNLVEETIIRAEPWCARLAVIYRKEDNTYWSVNYIESQYEQKYYDIRSNQAEVKQVYKVTVKSTKYLTEQEIEMMNPDDIL